MKVLGHSQVLSSHVCVQDMFLFSTPSVTKSCLAWPAWQTRSGEFWADSDSDSEMAFFGKIFGVSGLNRKCKCIVIENFVPCLSPLRESRILETWDCLLSDNFYFLSIQILDACAAPGSKTVQLIELLHGEETLGIPGKVYNNLCSVLVRILSWVSYW